MTTKITFRNMTSRVFADNEDYKNSDTPITYVSAKNGVFVQKINQIGRYISKTEDDGLLEIEEGFTLDIPKIPFSLFSDMAAWFRTIYELDKTESTAFIMYKEGEGHSIFIPEQENAGATSDYKRHDDTAFVLKEAMGYKLVMVAHSHPWKSGGAPGPSGTDNKDEKEAILYLIMNNVEGIPNYFCSTCPDGDRQELKLFDVFENPLTARDEDSAIKELQNKFIPEEEVVKLFFEEKSIEIPANWLAKHSTSKLVATNKYLSRDPKGKGIYASYQEVKNRSFEEFNFDGLTDKEADDLRAQDYYARERQLHGQETFSSYDPGWYSDNKGIDLDSIREEIRMEVEDEFIDNGYGIEADDVIDLVLGLEEENLSALISCLIDEGYDSIIAEQLMKSTTKKRKKSPLNIKNFKI